MLVRSSPARFTSSPWAAACCSALLILVALPIDAQYSVGAPSTISARGEIPEREDLEDQWEEARWNLGALRVQPWIGIDQVGFVTDQDLEGLEVPDDAAEERETTDFTATVGAGVRGYARLGRDVMLAAHVLPEYVWWREADERSGLAGRYGAGLFGHWNRLHAGLSHRLEERQGFYNSEVLVLTRLREQASRGEVEIEVFRDLWLFGAVEERSFEETGDVEEIFRALDRDESVLEAGVRLLSRRGLSLAVGVREQETEFDDTARPLSNDESALFLTGTLEGQRVDLAFHLTARELEATSGSLLGTIDETTGSLQVTFHARERADLFVLADRTLDYSIDPLASTFLEDRFGAGVSARFGRTRLQLFAAQGEVEVTGLTTGGVARDDEFTEVAADFQVELRRLATVGVNASWRDYESEDSRFTRDVARVGLTIRLGEILDRLRLGESSSRW
ncbi:MAG: hypothetical protein AAGC60_06460 [Acidobacteriota bacterium]